ncbi:MAG: ComF family protein [Eubacteriales bacterium]|nr:ComF family protein [Eubacteriales bacterium]
MLLTLLFPQRVVCHACGEPLRRGEGLLCGACAAELAKDAFPLGRAQARIGECADCAMGAFRYQGTAEALMRALKFGADQTAALPLAEGMAAVYAATAELRGVELCVAVPMHGKRLRRRGYNQAEVLAEAFAQSVGLRLEKDMLTRLHHKRSQVGQGRAARRENIAGAFALCIEAAPKVRGRRILLVDDVLTTGATAEECARVLLEAGAEQVRVLTACRA